MRRRSRLSRNSPGRRLRNPISRPCVGPSLILEPTTFSCRTTPAGCGCCVLNPQRLPPGTMVMASGFYALEDDVPVLKEAVLRPENPRGNVAPVVLADAELPTIREAQKLVRLRATLLGQSLAGAERLLQLRTANSTFEAVVPANRRLPDFELGSVLQVEGVCRFLPRSERAHANQEPEFKLMLASAEDVRLLEAPQWWTLKRTLTLLGLLAAVVLVGSPDLALRNRLNAHPGIRWRWRRRRLFLPFFFFLTTYTSPHPPIPPITPPVLAIP